MDWLGGDRSHRCLFFRNHCVLIIISKWTNFCSLKATVEKTQCKCGNREIKSHFNHPWLHSWTHQHRWGQVDPQALRAHSWHTAWGCSTGTKPTSLPTSLTPKGAVTACWCPPQSHCSQYPGWGAGQASDRDSLSQGRTAAAATSVSLPPHPARS